MDESIDASFIKANAFLSSKDNISSSFDIFPEEFTFTDRLVYWISRPIATLVLYPLISKRMFRLMRRTHIRECGYEILMDLGGKRVELSLGDEGRLIGILLKKENYFQSKEKVFKKWKELLSRKSHRNIAFAFEVVEEEEDFINWLRMPSSIKECSASGKKKAVIYCAGAGSAFEINPHYPIMSLERGQDVFVFNYRGISESEGTPGFKATCEDAVHACHFIKDRLGYSFHEMVIHGTSMGSGPAVYAGVTCEGINVVIDRGFCRMSEVVNSKFQGIFAFMNTFIEFFAEKFYTYPNEELLSFVKGEVLLIQAEKDVLMEEYHYERLFDALKKGKLHVDATEEEIEEFRKKSWLKLSGSHSSISGGDSHYSWISFHEDQAAFNKFFE